MAAYISTAAAHRRRRWRRRSSRSAVLRTRPTSWPRTARSCSPVCYTTTGERTFILDHQGDDPATGWKVYAAYPVGRDASCTSNRSSARARSSTATANTIDVTDLAPPPAGVNPIVEGGAPRRCSSTFRWRHADRDQRRADHEPGSLRRWRCAVDEAFREDLGVLVELAPAHRQTADDVGTGVAERVGQLVEGLARIESERAERRRLLAAHRRQVGDARCRPRCLSEDERSVHPRADERSGRRRGSTGGRVA